MTTDNILDTSASAALSVEGPLRILVAWNPDSSSTEALSFAAWLGRTADVRVRAVTTFLRPWPTTSLSKLGGKYGKWFDKQTRAYTKAVHKAFHDAGISEDSWDDTVAVFSDGTTESTLLTEAATNFDAHIVILGSGASAQKGRFRAGSTSDALMHSSPHPLGLAPRAVKLSKHGVTRINVAYLDSRPEETGQSLLLGAQLAQRWNIPLRLAAFSSTGLTKQAGSSKIDVFSELADGWHEHALGMLDVARDSVMDHFPELSVDTEIASGKGWAGAFDALPWKKGDLLCMGSHPVGPLARVFVGSTAAEFLQHVRIPVIVNPVRRN